MIVGTAAPGDGQHLSERALDPDPSQAYVMYPGKPYAHLMIPVDAQADAAK